MKEQLAQFDLTDWRQQAAVYWLGFISGYFTKDEVIAWADDVIAREDRPEPTIIDISLGKTLGKQDVACLLKNLAGEAHTAQAFKILLGLYATIAGNVNVSRSFIAYRLYSTLPASEEMLLNPNRDAQTVDDFHSFYVLAESGEYGTVEEVDRRFTTFLAQYRPFADEFLAATEQMRSTYGKP